MQKQREIRILETLGIIYLSLLLTVFIKITLTLPFQMLMPTLYKEWMTPLGGHAGFWLGIVWLYLGAFRQCSIIAKTYEGNPPFNAFFNTKTMLNTLTGPIDFKRD